MLAPHHRGGELVQLDQAALPAIRKELKLATSGLQRELNCEGRNGGWNPGRADRSGSAGHLHCHPAPAGNSDTKVTGRDGGPRHRQDAFRESSLLIPLESVAEGSQTATSRLAVIRLERHAEAGAVRLSSAQVA